LLLLRYKMLSWNAFRRLPELTAIIVTGFFSQEGGQHSTTLLQLIAHITNDSHRNRAYAVFRGVTDRMIVLDILMEAKVHAR